MDILDNHAQDSREFGITWCYLLPVCLYTHYTRDRETET